MSDERGLATVPPIATGAVKVHVEFPGFEASDSTLTLRRGATNQTITLGIAGVQEEVVVNDTAGLLDDRSGNAQTTTLEQSEIDALPDDPDELAEVLQQMTGGSGATFQVNGFRGGRLPSRDEIRQIRFRTNSFAADNHDAGRAQIEIITRPNVREWSGNANLGLRGDVLNARNAFAQTETPEQFRRFNTGLRGPIVAGKTSIRFGLDGNRAYDSPPIYAVNEDGTQFHGVVYRPSESTNATIGIEHALTKNQTLRIEYRRNHYNAENQGVGDFTMPERAVERTTNEHQARVQVQGLIGKTTLHELRVQFNRQENEATSVSDLPSINVLDAFNRGGAGVNNHGYSRTIEVADNVDFNLGRKHAMRVGAMVEGGVNRNFDARNAAGTFTFSSLEAFNAGLPLQFTQRNGQVNTSFTHYELGFYWQDDIRVSRNLSFSVGVRQEMQSLIDDKLNVMPRLGFSWNAPAKLTVRGGYGTFYDWYDTGLYDQTLRVNGVSQRDLLILNPGYPESVRRRQRQRDPAGRPRAVGAGSADAVRAPGLDRRRARAHHEPAGAGVLSVAARTPPDAVGEHQRARRRWRAPGTEHRHRDAVRIDRALGERSADLQSELPRAEPPHLHGRQLHARPGEEPRRQRHHAAGEQPRSRRRVGAVVPGRAPPHERDGQPAVLRRHARQCQRQRAVGHAVHDHDRHRRQSRWRRQRSARRRRRATRRAAPRAWT